MTFAMIRAMPMPSPSKRTPSAPNNYQKQLYGICRPLVPTSHTRPIVTVAPQLSAPLPVSIGAKGIYAFHDLVVARGVSRVVRV
jgi:hypothetical protein